MNKRLLNPNIVGIIPVFVWGASLPIAKMLMGQLGALAVLGAVQMFCGVVGLLEQKFVFKTTIDKKIFRHPLFYARGFFFLVHIGLIYTACAIVSKDNVPLVLLLNYFWPTALIVFSVLLTGVKVERSLPFVGGLVLVFTSLAIELLEPSRIDAGLFALKTDVIAYACAFCGALCWALYSALSRRGGEAAGGGTVVPLYQFALGFVLPVSALPDMATWGNMTLVTGGILGVYLVFQLIAYTCWDYGMRKGNVVFLSLCADAMPWISLTTAYFVLGAPIGLKTVFAAVLLVTGALMTRAGTLARKKAPPLYAAGDAD